MQALNFFDRQTKLPYVFLVVFFAICSHYASYLNLWGDEAFSLDVAESHLKNFDPTDHHTPTYYVILTILILARITNELAIRFFHIIPFAIGLLIGYRLLIKIFKQPTIALYTLSICILLPNFIFYATNIRMYSILFLTSMLFIDNVFDLINQDVKNLSLSKQFKLFLCSLLLLISDYPGIIYFMLGLLFLLIKSYLARSYKIILPVTSACFVFLIYMFFTSDLNQGVESILHWSGTSSHNIPGFSYSLTDIAKFIYLSLRPGLDLIYSAGLSLPIAIGLPLLLISLYFWSLVVVWKENSKSIAHIFILSVSLIWVLTAPTGYSFTRLFLPSHFFMIAVIISFWNQSKQNFNKLGISLILFSMIMACMLEIIHPTLRLYNLIPFQKIAIDTLDFIKQQDQTSAIFLSNNSLNTLSIERYMKQNAHKNLKIERINDQALKDLSKNFDSGFIFISHLQEDKTFVDIDEIAMDRSYQKFKNYIKLTDLPYNSLWKNKILKTSHQPYAIQTYLVRPLSK